MGLAEKYSPKSWCLQKAKRGKKELWSVKEIERWKESRRQEAPAGLCQMERKEPSEGRVGVTTAPCGHTCRFSFGEAETTEVQNGSFQDKRSYNYNSEL